MKSAVFLVLAPTLFFSGGWRFLESFDRAVEEGRSFFTDGKFKEASKAFGTALEDGKKENSELAKLHFNKGTADFKQAEESADDAAKKELYEKAAENFRKGTGSSDRALRSKSHYNLGNTQFRQGKLKDAVESYKRSLRADPKLTSARKNLDLTLRQLAAQPPQSGNGDKDEKNEENEKNEKKNEGNDKGKSDKGENQQKQDSGDEGSQQKQSSNDANEKGQDQKDQQDNGEADTKMPPRNQQNDGDAGRRRSETFNGQQEKSKLDALERRSRNLRKNKLRKSSKRQVRSESGKDW